MSDDASGGPGDRSALGRCIAVPADRFAAEFWGRSALLSPAEDLGRDFGDLFSSAAVDDLLADRGLRTPFLRMAKGGQVLPPGRFTASGGYGAEVADQVSADAVFTEFADGATIVLQGLHRTWRPIRDFTRRLVDEIGHPVQVNAYITPAASRGFDPHYDVHDVFVLQIAGEKRWVVHDPVLVHPFADEPWADVAGQVAARAEEAPAIETVLRPGDALYLPRGWIHSATALGGTTVHLTVGMPAVTRSDVARRLLEQALRSDALRAPLPLGVDLGDPASIADDVAAAQAALRDALDRVDPAPVAAALGARLTRQVRAEAIRPLAAVEAIAALDPGSTVRWRDGLRATTVVEGDRVEIRLPSKTVRLPAEAGPAVAALAAGGAHRAGALQDLDEADSLVVSRRLLREGVLVPGP